ncbi:helix-turn-helix transcriptional regulator [Hoeflea sp.]|uniref:helix-turn-helix transcriptional regulator n=1 Tax=Hoeflea sp. TaxID=1940281 RepID=UPI003B516A53
MPDKDKAAKPSRSGDPDQLFETRAELPEQIRRSGLFDLDYDPEELARMHRIFELLPDQTVLDLSKRLERLIAEGAPDFAAFSERFGISPAERKLLESLVEGLTVVAHAEKAGISVNTARTHMRRLLEKTGSAGQLDLIRKAHGQS